MIEARLKIDDLCAFLGRLSILQKTRLAQRMRSPGFSVEIWERPNGDIDSVLAEIDHDDRDAFVLHWRLFVQNNDRISVRNVATRVSGPDVPEEMKMEFKRLRDELNQFLDAKPIIPYAGVSNNREFLDAVLYGRLAHADAAQSEMVSDWEKMHGASEVEHMFVDALDQASQRLFALAAPVGCIVKVLRAAA